MGHTSHRRRPPAGFSVVELLVVLTVILLILAMFMPAVQDAREAARRTQCQNNLKQLGLALQVYAEYRNVFPPGVVNEEGPILQEPLGYHVSWTVQILPCLDQRMLGNVVDPAYGVYEGANASLFTTVVPTFVCPSNQDMNIGNHVLSSYAGCHHHVEAPIDMSNVGVFTLNSSTTAESVRDGMTHTIFIGEVRLPRPDALLDLPAGRQGLLGWPSGTRATLRNTSSINRDLTADEFGEDLSGPVGGFGSDHAGGAYFGFGDGSVRFLKENIDPQVLQNLAHPADGNLLDF